VDFGAFNPLSYQFLFIIGLAFGTSQVNLGRLPPIARKWLIGSCAVVAAAFFALRQDYAFHGPFVNLLYRLREWLGAVELGPLRVLSFAAFAVILYWVCSKVEWKRTHSSTFRWLAFVGRHSLPVFAWSILANYAAVAFFPYQSDEALRLAGVFVAIASLTIPAYVHALLRQRRAPFAARSVVAAVHVGSARRAA
jgi:hypothetical protein